MSSNVDPQHIDVSEAEFWEFVKKVSLASRDQAFGTINPWGTQKVLIREIFDGIKKGIRQFLTCKAGQVGASTILQLLTLYWYTKSPGLQGVCVTDSDELREFFRDQFTLMVTHAQDDPDEAAPFRSNNKNQISWKNGSRLLFQTSGARTGNRLGVGRGFAFCHGTEVALWQNAASLTYLRTRFSDKHPHRLAVYESTARGKNWWFDLWEDSADAVDIKRIFLAWWMREDYSLPKLTPEFVKYWDNRYTRKEQHWLKELKKRYHVTLTPEQWAWRRWFLAEKAANDHRLADQEMPTLPEDAFEASGESFLGHDVVQQCRKTVRAAKKAAYYRYDFGKSLEDTDVKPISKPMADLTIWEDPIKNEAYVVAAVPAFSNNPDCATAVVDVWKANRDQLVQVAQFASTNVGLQTFSWVCVHLLGSYNVSRRAFILEVQGQGMAILQELKRLQYSGWGTNNSPRVRKIMGHIQHYLWKRPDSMSGSIALQWKSAGDTQGWLFRRLKDQLEAGTVVLKSEHTLAECERMRWIEGNFETTSRTQEEHRLLAAALSCESWSAQLRPLFLRVQGPHTPGTVMSKMVQGFFSQLAARA